MGPTQTLFTTRGVWGCGLGEGNGKENSEELRLSCLKKMIGSKMIFRVIQSNKHVGTTVGKGAQGINLNNWVSKVDYSFTQ